jgi:putative membrane protein
MKQFALVGLGFVSLVALWCGPLPEVARSAFAAHMGLHMGIVAVAAPLIALGLAGGRADPVKRAPEWFPPVPLSILELVIVWAWHAPALHQAARHTVLGVIVEQGMFLLAGLSVWLSAFGGGRERRRERTGAGIAALLLTSMHMTLLGALLALTPRALYSHGGHGSHLSPLEDQHLGGAIMLLVGGLSYLIGGLALTRRLLRPHNVEVTV